MINTTHRGDSGQRAPARANRARAAPACWARAAVPAALGGGGLDMQSSNFAHTILGEAVNKAVTDVAQQLGSRRPASLPTTVVHGGRPGGGCLAGRHASSSMSARKAGVKVGDKLDVKRKVREVHDPGHRQGAPQHGRPRRHAHHHRSGRRSAVGKFSGAGTAKVGDTVSNAEIGRLHGSRDRLDCRRLPGGRHPGRRRNGQGVQGPQRHFRPHRSHEGAAARPGQRARTGRPLPARNQGAGQPGASQHRRACTPRCAWKTSSSC